MFNRHARFAALAFAAAAVGLASHAVRADKAGDAATADTKEAQQHGPISWSPTFDLAKRSAIQSGKPILVDFWAEWCSPCKEMLATTYKNKAVLAKSKDFVPVLINVDRHGDVATKYNVGAFPTVLILDSHGREILRTQGFVSTKTMLAMMAKGAKIARSKRS